MKTVHPLGWWRDPERGTRHLDRELFKAPVVGGCTCPFDMTRCEIHNPPPPPLMTQHFPEENT